MATMREWVHRFFGSLRRGRRDQDLEQELAAHLALAAEDARTRGASAEDAWRGARIQLGHIPQAMDHLRDQRGVPRLDALASDARFAWRQLNRHRTVSLAAILSLGLAIGATAAAFRLVDAVLLRKLPVSKPDSLLYVSFTSHDSQNRIEERDDFDYPTYQRYGRAIGNRAEVLVVGMTAPQEVIVGDADEAEPVSRQFVSGNVFPVFGLHAAAGRLLGAADDDKAGGHAVAVIGYD